MQELRDAGYLPAAVRNYLALLGWGADDDTTLMSTEELVERFRVDDVGRAAAIFDEKKLRWVNGRFMREMPLDEYTQAVARHLGREADERLRAACAIVQEKAQTLEEVWPLIRFLFEPAGRRREGLAQGDEARGAPRLLEAARTKRSQAPSGFDAAAVEAALAPLPERLRRQARPPLPADPRRDHAAAPCLPGSSSRWRSLGRERSLARLDDAIERLRGAESRARPGRLQGKLSRRT